MKTVLVLYATRHGQTREVAERLAATLRARGLDPQIANAADAAAAEPVDLARYDAAVLAASVHLGKHEPEMVAFVKRHRAELERVPSAFLSVSMSEAGAEDAHATAEQRAAAAASVQQALDGFFADTGWHPARTQPVAGALRYRAYNPLVRFFVRMIAKQKGENTDTSRDHEFTDWAALERFGAEFASTILGESGAQGGARAAGVSAG